MPDCADLLSGLVLRPKTFYSNARDLALLKRFIAAQVPHYVDFGARRRSLYRRPRRHGSHRKSTRAPSPQHCRTQSLSCSRTLDTLPHHAAPDVVAASHR